MGRPSTRLTIAIDGLACLTTLIGLYDTLVAAARIEMRRYGAKYGVFGRAVAAV